jgi:inosine-uridine nucleoside N-ribohydrolase
MNKMLENETVKCWLDCDPGHDDAFAILLATFSDKINLIGISVSAGNQTLEKTTRNVINVLNIAGLINADNLERHQNQEIGHLPFPVIKGNKKPLMRPAVNCGEIHGECGLGTHGEFIYPQVPLNVQTYINNQDDTSTHFTTQIFKYIKRLGDEKITLIATGPLTNYALLILNYPDCSKYIEKIVLMGGAIGIGDFSKTFTSKI